MQKNKHRNEELSEFTNSDSSEGYDSDKLNQMTELEREQYKSDQYQKEQAIKKKLELQEELKKQQNPKLNSKQTALQEITQKRDAHKQKKSKISMAKKNDSDEDFQLSNKSYSESEQSEFEDDEERFAKSRKKLKKNNEPEIQDELKNKKGNANKYTGSREVKEEEKAVVITHLEKIRVSRVLLAKILSRENFLEVIVNTYVRISAPQKDIKEQKGNYLIGEIVGINEIPQFYQFEEKKTNKVLVIRHAKREKVFKMDCNIYQIQFNIINPKFYLRIIFFQQCLQLANLIGQIIYITYYVLNSTRKLIYLINRRNYSLYTIKQSQNFNESSSYFKTQPYIIQNYITFKLLMIDVSNSPFLTQEFSNWIVNMENVNLQLPTIEFINWKLSQIQNILNQTYSAEQIEKLVQKNINKKIGETLDFDNLKVQDYSIEIQYLENIISKLELECYENQKNDNFKELQENLQKHQAKQEKLKQIQKQFKEQAQMKKMNKHQDLTLQLTFNTIFSNLNEKLYKKQAEQDHEQNSASSKKCQFNQKQLTIVPLSNQFEKAKTQIEIDEIKNQFIYNLNKCHFDLDQEILSVQIDKQKI